MVRCDHPSCIAPSIGYADRQLQGPFYCKAHEQWALDLASKAWTEIEESFESERTHYDLHSIKDS